MTLRDWKEAAYGYEVDQSWLDCVAAILRTLGMVMYLYIPLLDKYLGFPRAYFTQLCQRGKPIYSYGEPR